ncbi:Transposase-like protein B [Methanosarcina horonobensis HB-1 = JCM 15518]|uniref:Transposase-like protein B n=2 Tax=Methanosarcina horonobensis TaxID=418008 RepID=A0A0E3SBP8_9EURY|nr:RNA-guided endonuclease TnpB family protein [Methanosarcina horonobensis]AKB77242.1 Transposase-like protein B [Methanosarcina horonobensis HB-1 = JCM 15518]
MHLTAKVKIYPTDEQLKVLWELSDKCCSLYNLALAERKDAWKLERKNIKYVDQQNKLPDLKKRNPEYKAVYSKTLQGVLKKLDADHRSFFALRKNGDLNARPPNFKNRKYFQTIPYNQSGFYQSGSVISFSHKINDTKLVFYIGKKFENIKQIEIYNDDPFHAKGDFYISVTYEVATPEYIDNGCYQTIDAGITKIVTCINLKGKFHEIKSPRPDKYWQPKMDKIKSRKDHCKKKSRKWVKLHGNYRIMERKKSNQLRDFQHKLSKKMVNNTKANTIIVGNLKVKNMAQSKKLKGKRKRAMNRSIQNQGYLSRFIEFLAYKAELIGKKVIKIDESYTSKTCYVCGKIHDMPLWKRNMECDCGNYIDRDRNSAINIMTNFLSQNALWTGYQKFSDNLRQTGLPTSIRFFEPYPQMT